MASKSTVNELMAVFIIIVLALALTPSVASFTTDAGYVQNTEYDEMTPSSSNSTTTDYTARNDSAKTINEL